MLRQPVVMAVLPTLAVATTTLLTSDHPLQVRQGLSSLWIGMACLLGWSFLLTVREHWNLLRCLAFPAAVLSILTLLQYYELFNPFRFERAVERRIGLTSFAGSAFDLAAYLVLPCLIIQASLWRAPKDRWLRGQVVAVVLSVYAVALTQTLTALLAVLTGSLLLWLLLLPRKMFPKVVGWVVLISLVCGLAISPLRVRVERKLNSLQRADVDRLVSGRRDGWQAAWWMVREYPLTGVGHGAYRAEFGNARMALGREGAQFYRGQRHVYFINAHSDPLEALAEWGLPGGAALLWGLYVLTRAIRRIANAGGEAKNHAALMGAGLVALCLLVSVNFPLRIALVAYPVLLFISWIFATERELGS